LTQEICTIHFAQEFSRLFKPKAPIAPLHHAKPTRQQRGANEKEKWDLLLARARISTDYFSELVQSGAHGDESN
jgi:hypothetical protein